MAIYDDVKITINLNELVEIRAKLQSQYGDYSEQVCKGEYLDESDIDRIATQLRETLTWDTLYFMVDGAILDYLGLKDLVLLQFYLNLNSTQLTLMLSFCFWEMSKLLLQQIYRR